MTKALHISKDLALPLDAITQTFGVVAARGAGKSYLAAVLSEELIGSGLPVCILDPLGVFWGLRSSADGKHAGLPVIILGGDHGDVPLEATAGKVIAEWVVSERRPCVLDLSLFRKGEQRQFVTDFAEHLYRANREPLHVVLDEADLFAPQRPMPGEQRMLGAIEDLVRRGRARGLGLTIITQRPAVVHKDILTQVSVLVALRMLGPQDRDAVDAWIKFHGTAEERKTVLASLGALPIGRAWVWSPGWLGILKQVQIRKRTTFDSSSTPGIGAKRVRPETLAPVDLDALTSKIEATIEKTKAEDPKALRKRIAELERELTAAKSAKPVDVVPQVVRVDVPVLDAKAITALERLVHVTGEQHETARALLESCETILASAVASRAVGLPAATRPRADTKVVDQVYKSIPRTNGAVLEAKLPKVERLVLTVLAQTVQRDLDRARLALHIGYHANSKGFANALGALRGRGAIDGTRITDVGLKELGYFEPLPSGPELLDWYCQNKLRPAEARILRAIAESPNLTRDQLADVVGYHPNAKAFANGLGRLRGLGLVEGMRISEELSA